MSPTPRVVRLGTFVAVDAVGHELVEGSRVVFEFTNEGLRVRTGCNAITGDVRVEGTRLYMDTMARTEMGCEQPLMAQEEWLAAFLGSAPDLAMEDDLTLTGRGVVPESLTLQLLQPEAPASIQSTHWKLTSLHDRDSASSVPAGVEGRLQLANGAISFSAGCNEFGGTVSIEARSGAAGFLVISTVIGTAKGCLDARGSVEATMAQVLQGRVPYTLSPQNTLTVGSRGGLALEFKPQ